MPTQLNETAPRVRLPRRVRERQMIDVATAVFGRNGYHAASMDQIADEASISKPMLYAYFNSKEGLYSACMRCAGQALIETVHRTYSTERSVEQRLWDGFLAYFTFVGERTEAWRLICFDAFPAMPEFRDIELEVQESLHSEVAELARLASSETAADPMADPERRAAFASAMFGAAEAIAVGWLEGEDRSPEVPCRHLMNFFWLGGESLIAGREWSEARLR